VGRGEPPDDRRDEIADVGRALDLLGPGPGHEDVARHALLEQEFGRLDDRIGMEPLDHHVAVEDVAEGHQRHPLVVGHVASDDGDGLVLR
jgi:hypothetical protein